MIAGALTWVGGKLVSVLETPMDQMRAAMLDLAEPDTEGDMTWPEAIVRLSEELRGEWILLPSGIAYSTPETPRTDVIVREASATPSGGAPGYVVTATNGMAGGTSSSLSTAVTTAISLSKTLQRDPLERLADIQDA